MNCNEDTFVLKDMSTTESLVAESSRRTARSTGANCNIVLLAGSVWGGTAVGAGIGTAMFPVIGTMIGGLIGMVAGDLGGQFIAHKFC